jgi:biopolymer transport protein ExbD
MRFVSQEPEAEELLKIAPMVDMVFILLAFFIMGTQFLSPERDFSMGYRKAELAPGAAREDFPSTIPVQLRRTGAGVAITVGQARLPDNDFDAIRAKLSQINMPGIAVLVMADPALTVDQVARALDAALASPMKRVSVARLRVRPPDAR